MGFGVVKHSSYYELEEFRGGKSQGKKTVSENPFDLFLRYTLNYYENIALQKNLAKLFGYTRFWISF